MSFSCFIIGEGPVVVGCIDVLLAKGHQVLGVVSPDPRVCRLASKGGLPIHQTSSDIDSILCSEPFDYLFSVYWRNILSPSLLELPRRMAINFHDGPLPKYAGVHATAWAVINREPTHGVSWHVMTDRLDAGDLLKQTTFDTDTNETTASLDLKCIQAGVDSFETLVDELDLGSESRVPQKLENRSFFPRHRRPPCSAVLDWQKTASELDALCRALDFGTFRNNDFGVPKIFTGTAFLTVRSAGVGPAANRPPGTIISIDANQLAIATADGALRLREFSSVDGHPIEVDDLYEGWGLELGMQLPSLDVSTARQVEAMQTAVVKQEEFWIRQLGDWEPLRFPYPVKPRSAGCRRQWELIEVEKAAAVDRYLDTHDKNSQRAETLAAVFLMFVARLSAQTHFAVWFSPEALGRRTERLSALYSAHVPFHISASGRKHCGQVVGSILEGIVELNDRGSFCRDIFARYAGCRAALEAANIAVEIRGRSIAPSSPAFLRLVVGQRGRGFSLLFDPSFIERDAVSALEAQFQTFLEGVAAAPDGFLKDMPLLTQPERERVVAGWNARISEPASELCVHQLIEAQVERTPDQVAAVCGSERMTYRVLNEKANQLAMCLAAKGVARGCYVPVLMPACFDLLISYLAIMKAAAVFVPFDPDWPAKRVGSLFNQLDVRIALLRPTEAKHWSKHLEDAVLPVIVDYRQLPLHSENPNQLIGAGDPMYVIFTSGSTGMPKGVVNHHGGAVNRFLASNREVEQFGIDEVKVANTSAPVFDPSIRQLLWPLTRGGSVVIQRHDVPSEIDPLLKFLASQGITVISLVASLFNVLVERLAADPESQKKLASVRHFQIGGEQVDPKAVYRFKELFPHINVTIIYGPSETAIGVISHTVMGPPTDVLPIGRPLPNVLAYILNDGLEPLPVGVVGELCIGGVQVGLGYLNDPDATAAAFVPNPFGHGRLYRTGDSARFLPDGNIVFMGRRDDQVKVHGVRVELGEVKAVLDSHPDVAESVVVVTQGPGTSLNLNAYVVPRGGSPLSSDQLRTFLAESLPAAFVPARFLFLDAFPRLASGKVDRRRLGDPTLSATKIKEAALSESEKRLLELWRRVVGHDQIGIHDNFFEVGGDSVRAIQLLSSLRSDFGLEVSLQRFFDEPTIQFIARLM